MSEQEQETQEQDGPEPDESPEEQPTPIQPPDEEEEEAEDRGDPDDTRNAQGKRHGFPTVAEAEARDGVIEPEPVEPQALSQKQLEKALDKLDREAERHNKRVAEIMGEDVSVLLDCPLCDPLTPGKIMPTPDTPERFPAVRTFMGDAQPGEYAPAPDATRCETCNGYGVVDTGSRVQSQAHLPCKTCDGRGWIGERAQTPTFPPPALAPPVENNGPATAFTIEAEPPEAAELRAKGYTLIPPVGS